ncbi:hypothetical protein B6D60_05855 [candidate division KSB1 bacterium 4484_87]|nr:MAG: hypothetical protein B6D60_05855 [candidate division KSB1 bacterium 4484_87]
MEEIKKISIIGAGRVGVALAKALAMHGFSIADIVDQDENRLQWARQQCTAENYCSNLKKMIWGDAVFLCVPDDQIHSVANELSRSLPEMETLKFAFHCAGSRAADELLPLSDYGIKIASMHPVQTFFGAQDDYKKTVGIYWAIEGDEDAVSAAKVIIGKLKGEFILLSASAKPIHHLACTFASNYLNFLLSLIIEFYQNIGIDETVARKMVLPLASTTLENIGEKGLEEALTGPIARGDLGTLEKHLKILSEKFPEFEIIYKLLAKRVFEYSSVIDELDVGTIQQLKKLFNE